MDAKNLVKALDMFEKEKGISKEIVIDALKEALDKAYKRENDLDAMCRVEINPVTGVIEMYSQKTVVDDVEDDVYQVELEDAIKVNPDIKVGEVLETSVDPDTLNRLAAMQAKQVFTQKIREYEKQSIYDEYIDKKDDLITGIVERVEPNFILINVGKTNAIMKINHALPGETYKRGDMIKVYVVDVDKSAQGAAVIVSRTEPGFLKRIFESEIHEIYDGTVEIKDIARQAGVRSKVSVFSNNKNVDATGACIGQKGYRIQNISSSLMGEKIDVIEYFNNPVLYIAEALKPAEVLGIDVDEEGKFAIAVVKDDDLSLAIGKRGLNARLAVKLTGYKIDIVTESLAIEEGTEYTTLEAAKEAYLQELSKKEEELRIAKEKEFSKKYAAALARQEEKAMAKKEENTSTTAEKEVIPAPKVSVRMKTEVNKERKPYVGKKDEKVLEELKKIVSKTSDKNSKKPRKTIKKEEEKEVKHNVVSSEELSEIKKKHEEARNYMPVYTESELEELEDEKDNVVKDDFYDEIDYDEYDEYYDEE